MPKPSQPTARPLWIRIAKLIAVPPVLLVAAAAAWPMGGLFKAASTLDGLVLPIAVGAFAYLPLRLVLGRLVPHAVNLAETIEHEATHALFCYLSFGRVEGIEVYGDGNGRVRMTRDNFIVTLAPYCFPLYCALSLALFAVVREAYVMQAAALVGVGYGFHVASTLNELRGQQPDITGQGRVFSYAMILAVNVLLCGVITSFALHGFDGIPAYLASVVESARSLCELGRRYAGR